MEDWALIRRLVADGIPQRQVARDLGIGRSTVVNRPGSDGGSGVSTLGDGQSLGQAGHGCRTVPSASLVQPLLGEPSPGVPPHLAKFMESVAVELLARG
nr:helix-turn-helix domain-containing protein [Mumia xiangluensis]